MKAVPQVVFVVDTTRESIVIREARQLGIPVVGIIDSNSDPDDVDFGIPGNDDAIRSVNLITEVIAEAVLAGQNRGTVSEAEIMAGLADELAGGAVLADAGAGVAEAGVAGTAGAGVAEVAASVATEALPAVAIGTPAAVADSAAEGVVAVAAEPQVSEPAAEAEVTEGEA
jgi:small subunit ribosomal protein S2